MMDRSKSPPFICLVSFLLFFNSINPGLVPVVLAYETKLLLLPLPLPLPPPHTISKQVNGTTWCIVKPSTSQEKLDQIIAFCCTQPNVDCGVIQAGGMCYLPPNKNSDASVVMNIYYKLNGENTSDCYFQGSGLIVTEDPSVDKCIYQA